MSGKEGGEAAAYIPPDLWEEILSRLPSNHLLNYKLVCKDWVRLISSTGFIQKHLERSKAECNDSKIVVPVQSMIEILHCTNNTGNKKIVALERPELFGSCDGLVLYYDHYCQGRIAAFNPSTGESVVSIPNQSMKDDIEHDWLICTWFGHHPSTGEYVLVVANLVESKEETALDRIVFKVYSLSRLCNNMNIICSSSLELDDMNSCMIGYQKIGTFLHGKLHCLPMNFDYPRVSYGVILVYDFETNGIARMSPPVECCQTLGVVDGCLSALIFDKKQVWMMKEYGVKESWTKFADVEGMEDGDILSPFGFCPNGDADTSDIKFCYCYCLRLREREREIKKIKILKTYSNDYSMPREAIACIDTLVAPTLLWREQENTNSS